MQLVRSHEGISESEWYSHAVEFGNKSSDFRVHAEQERIAAGFPKTYLIGQKDTLEIKSGRSQTKGTRITKKGNNGTLPPEMSQVHLPWEVVRRFPEVAHRLLGPGGRRPVLFCAVRL